MPPNKEAFQIMELSARNLSNEIDYECGNENKLERLVHSLQPGSSRNANKTHYLQKSLHSKRFRSSAVMLKWSRERRDHEISNRQIVASIISLINKHCLC